MSKHRIDPWLTVAGILWAAHVIGWLAYFTWRIWRIWSGQE